MKKILILTFTLIAFLSVHAQQFVLIDKDTTWTNTTFFRQLPDGQPDNWLTPVNYQEGKVYCRFEVLDKPTDIEVIAHFCLWDGKAETCYRRAVSNLKFTGKGVYYTESPAPADTSYWNLCSDERFPETTYYDGTRKIDKVMFQFWVDKDDAGELKVLRYKGGGVKQKEPGIIDYGNGYEEHVPIRFKATIIVVAKDAEFLPPKGW